MKDGSEVCLKYKNGICLVTGKEPDVKLLCGEAYPWTTLMISRDKACYKSRIDIVKSQNGYNPNVKSEEWDTYKIWLVNRLAGLPEEEFHKTIKRLKGK